MTIHFLRFHFKRLVFSFSFLLLLRVPLRRSYLQIAELATIKSSPSKRTNSWDVQAVTDQIVLHQRDLI